MIILTAPGNFYNRDRYFNEVIGDGDRDLAFTARWISISKTSNLKILSDHKSDWDFKKINRIITTAYPFFTHNIGR